MVVENAECHVCKRIVCRLLPRQFNQPQWQSAFGVIQSLVVRGTALRGGQHLRKQFYLCHVICIKFFEACVLAYKEGYIPRNNYDLFCHSTSVQRLSSKASHFREKSLRLISISSKLNNLIFMNVTRIQKVKRDYPFSEWLRCSVLSL
jgi:hypothetical protein